MKKARRRSLGVYTTERQVVEPYGPFCRLYAFPRDPDLFKIWEHFSKRADSKASPRSRLCSCHFPDGDKSKRPNFHFFEGFRRPLEFSDPEPARKRQKVNVEEKVAVAEPRQLAEVVPAPPPPCCVDLQNENSDLKRKNSILQNEVYVLREGLLFTYDYVCSRGLVRFYTGLDSRIFEDLAKILTELKTEGYSFGSRFGGKNELLMILMKLRHNFGFEDLAMRFNRRRTALQELFYSGLYLLHRLLFVCMIQRKFPTLKKIQANWKPECFKDFPNVRIIIDCTEIKCQEPLRMDQKKQIYSNYKSYYTYKALVGISPNGCITFVSDLYGGSTSDKELTKQSGLLDLLNPGDQVMADKGFTIADVLPNGVTLNIPPFLRADETGKKQFTVAQAKATTKIARARVHVERIMPRIKMYKILSEMTARQRGHASVIFQTCAGLANLQPPIIKTATPDSVTG